MRRNRTIRMLSVGIVFVIVSGMLPLTMAADNFDNTTVQIEVEDSGYPATIAPSQKWFVPGDIIEITIEVTGTPDGLEDIFDIIIFKAGDTFFSDRVLSFDNVAVDSEDGKGSVTVSDTYTHSLPDGNYDVYVGDEAWIEDNGFDSGRFAYNWTWFRIQMYTIVADTDSWGYIPGDTVSVFYSVISIRDGTLMEPGMIPNLVFQDREWAVWSQDGETAEGPNSLTSASGSFNFKISNIGNSWPDDYLVGIWFNGTYGAEREAYTFLYGNMGAQDFRVDTLDMSVWTDRGTYQLGSIVTVTVDIDVRGTNAPEQDVDVEITILEGTGIGADVIVGYGGDNFVTDASGGVVYAFNLDTTDFEEDETYTVRVSASKWLKEDSTDVIFDIAPGGRAIAVNMVFDKGVYTSGDTVQINVETEVPAGASTDLTFIYSVASEHVTYAMETTDSNLFSFSLPDNFEGKMYFDVSVYNTDKDYGYDSEIKDVEYGILLVNVNKDEYSAGDTLIVNYELISYLITLPDMFYLVRDDNGMIVEEDVIPGSALKGYVTFDVPSVPSASYTFFIHANQDGRILSASDVAYLELGYELIISFDKSNYLAGETAIIQYNLILQGGAPSPSSFRLQYSLYSYTPRSLTTNQRSGEVTYTMPSNIPDGSYLFMFYEFVTLTYAMTTVRIGPADPGAPGIGPDFDDDGVPDSADLDDDNDGYSDVIEEQDGSDPKNDTSMPPDNDEDYVPDWMDVDDDNDGYSDGEELMAESDPFNSLSVPTEEEVSVAAENVWEWLAPAIMGVIALVVAFAALLLARRPPKGEVPKKPPKDSMTKGEDENGK